ncbi:hypothetical protein [Rhodopseudomonas sp. B29]|uniref:hypothetical protein n=1 Tax=Rhodopseudomonas sp. B29 TaxID=95607 RepID=UPI00034BCE7D|nr:hypothetical protein [Rhodopseudomonas sp. B29]
MDSVLRSASVKLNAAQRRRLAWLADRLGQPKLYQRGERVVEDDRLLIVTDPLNSAGAQLFYSAINAGSVVVLPFSENPAFDFLKSKLTEYGTVGAGGADGPHEMWWGGVGFAEGVIPTSAPGRLRVVSCYPRRSGEAAAIRLQRATEQYGLPAHIEPLDSESDDDGLRCLEKVEFLSRMFARYTEPLLFVETGADIHQLPLLPARLAADVAIHKWNRWEMSARTVYLGRTKAAEGFLAVWQQLAALCPTIWDGALLDQAWCLASSQCCLDTVWLPRSYHALQGDVAEHKATIVHDLASTTADLGPDPSFAAIARAPRRAGRTGSRDSQVVMQSATSSTDSVAVILRDIASADARAVASTLEETTSAFAQECGGFGRLEVTLCAWADDLAAARSAARSARASLLEITPGQHIPRDIFVSLPRRGGATLSTQH